MTAVVIIVTYNAMFYLQKCLDSCQTQRVIVVDNNSTDETVPHIKKYYPKVHLLPQNKNLGFGRANNIGIKYALDQGFSDFFLLNQDAYLRAGTIEKLQILLRQNPDFGILSPIHLNGKGNMIDEYFSRYLNISFTPNLFSDLILKRQLKSIYEVPFINAAGWLVSRNVLLNVGGFDPIFFHYGEDNNYCQRLLYHGFKIGVVPDTFILHDREKRSHINIRKGSQEYYYKFATRLKTTFANINIDNEYELLQLKIRKRFERFKFFLKFKFKEMRISHQEYKLICKLYPKILNSRRINQKKASNYL